MLWSDPGYEAVVRLLRERAGLIFPPARQAAVERTIQRAMVRAGVRDLAQFAALVWREGALREELLGELTIGETYFFREPEQFGFLRREVVPGLLRRRGEDRPLRFWSAGCASGEEPYSLAILCEQLGVLGRTRILGTELSRQRLERARRASYGHWSFRGVPAEVIGTYFERRGNHFELDPRLRRAVEFRTLNLVEDIYPSPELGHTEFDLILCRNVLIYFDIETVALVAERLLASLAEGGWLLLGASDPLLSEFVPCTVVITGSGIAYQREGDGVARGPNRSRTGKPPLSPPAPLARPAATIPEAGWQRVITPPADLAAPTVPATPVSPCAEVMPETVPGDAPGTTSGAVTGASPGGVPYPTPGATSAGRVTELQAAYESGDYELAAWLAEGAVASGGGAAHIWVLWVRSLANLGRLDEAGRVCAGALDLHRLSGELAYLHAVLLLQAGRYDAAAAAARRALYLDRRLIMAHLVSARALGQLGQREGELHALKNAGRLLATMAADEVVPASDGECAGYLREVVRTQLQLLSEVH